MKSCLFIFLFLVGSFLNAFCRNDEKEVSHLSAFSFSLQEAPFYFLKPVPATIMILSKVELSFFRNQSIVTQYRYKVEIPEGGGTVIDRNITRWSPWIGFDLIELIIPSLDREGGYKLNIEFRTSKNNEILKFEKLFYVYRFNPASAVETSRSLIEPVKANTGSRPMLVSEVPATKTKPVTENTSKNARPPVDKATAKSILPSGSTAKIIAPAIEKVTIKSRSIGILALNKIDLKEDSKYKELIHQKDEQDVMKARPLTVPENKPAQPAVGPNHETAINIKDNNGNTPLLAAILAGENEYTKSLIDQGADLNIKNKLDLSPMHIAVFLNNRTVVNHLLMKGAEVDIKGNTGYTPLHIASELNHSMLVKDLLYAGASRNITTDQKLSAKAIARIQNNNEVVKILVSKGAFTLTPPESGSNQTGNSRNIARLSPKYEFSLPYNGELLRKRQLNNLMKIISIPVFTIATAGTIYLRTEANNHYSSYINAETREMAKHHYDMTTQFDTYTYISGGLSLTSAFGIVHLINRKKSISNKMRK
jgi:hypothetical protein